MLDWQVTQRWIAPQKMPYTPASVKLDCPSFGLQITHTYLSTKQWHLRWHSETENKLHSIERRVNVINMLRLPRREEIIIHWLRIGHILRMDAFFEGRLSVGAWLVKWIWLLSMHCFIVFPLKMLVIIVLCNFDLHVWIVFESRFTLNNRFY